MVELYFLIQLGIIKLSPAWYISLLPDQILPWQFTPSASLFLHPQQFIGQLSCLFSNIFITWWHRVQFSPPAPPSILPIWVSVGLETSTIANPPRGIAFFLAHSHLLRGHDEICCLALRWSRIPFSHSHFSWNCLASSSSSRHGDPHFVATPLYSDKKSCSQGSK